MGNNIENWVASYTEELYNWAYYKTSSKELAEDLVQETFLVAAEKINNFKGDSSPKTWLFSILNHKIIDTYRKKFKQPVNIEGNLISTFFEDTGEWQSDKKPTEWTDGNEKLLDDEDFRLILNNCLDALPEKWSLSVRFKYLSEKNSEEICQELGISTTNYWQIVHRAKLQLRNCITKNWF